MDIRPTTPADLDAVADIDGTIEATQYLHVDLSGEGTAMTWKIEERPLREKMIGANRLADDDLFTLEQIVAGADEGLALAAEHDGVIVAHLFARVDHGNKTLRIVDVRVDYDYRRQGVGLAMLFQAVQHAREQQLRAVMATTQTSNLPAARFLSKAGFDITGLDTRRITNHDLVKERVTLFWYSAFD